MNIEQGILNDEVIFLIDSSTLLRLRRGKPRLEIKDTLTG